MNLHRWLTPALLFVATAAAGAEPAPPKTPPTAHVVRQDGSTVVGRVVSMDGETLRLEGPTGPISLELKSVKSLELRSDSIVEKNAADSPIRIGLMELGLKQQVDAMRRLDRIGATYEVIPPDAPLERLRQFQILYFCSSWAGRNGLGELKDKFDHYVRDGGAMLFAQPDVDGEAERHPALRLLPYPVKMSSYSVAGGDTERAFTDGSPHLLMQNVELADLPYAYDQIKTVGPGWTVLAECDTYGKAATLVVADVGRGRVLLHTDLDDYGHERRFRDPFFVRTLKWLARRPDADILSNTPTLGERRYESFLVELTADYERLLAAESPAVRLQVRDIEHLLLNESSIAGPRSRDVLQTVRQLRSKATIPLLIRALAEQRQANRFRDIEIPRTLGILTGEIVFGGQGEEIAQKWWFPNRETITVDPARMTRDQREHAVNRLLEIVAKGSSYLDQRARPLDAYALYHLIQYKSDMHYWNEADFPDLFVSTVLEAADHSLHRFAALIVLTELSRKDRIKNLEAVVRDPKAPAGRRIMAATAVVKNQSLVLHKELISLLHSDIDAELRATAIMTLGYSRDPAAVEAVVSYLRSKDDKLFEAALWATSTQQAPEAVAPLGERLQLELVNPLTRTRWIIRTLGTVRTAESAALLGKLLEKTARERPHDDAVAQLLDAYESVVGKRFVNYSIPRKPSEIDEGVRLALKWHQSPKP